MVIGNIKSPSQMHRTCKMLDVTWQRKIEVSMELNSLICWVKMGMLSRLSGWVQGDHMGLRGKREAGEKVRMMPCEKDSPGLVGWKTEEEARGVGPLLEAGESKARVLS